MTIETRDLRRALHLISATIGFLALWHFFAPFYGPEGTQKSNRSVNSIAFGDRGLCRPSAVAIMTASLDDDAYRSSKCQNVGVERWETAWMLTFTALFLAGITSKYLPARRPTPPRWATRKPAEEAHESQGPPSS